MEQIEKKIKRLLVEIYGEALGRDNFSYLRNQIAEYRESLSSREKREAADFDPEDPYAGLRGTVFAIAYPDNIFEETRPTLETLGRILKEHYPGIDGIHILPERYMSHNDVWPQDLHCCMGARDSVETVDQLRDEGILDSHGRVTDLFMKRKQELKDDFPRGVLEILDLAYNSHFNDGGFSQKDRSLIDPRFGTDSDLEHLCDEFAVMLDFVVNHLDVDNPVLDAYRSGRNDGRSFIIISPGEYKKYQEDGTVDAVFRPRPFPLFTGMRCYADGREESDETIEKSVEAMNRIFSQSGLAPLDGRLVSYLAISYKHENDQGLTARDERILSSFLEFCSEQGIDEEIIFLPSGIHENGKIFTKRIAGEPVKAILELFRKDESYASLFEENHNEVFGRLFYIYTTFSESQVDVNPVTRAGFSMIVDDLFHFLSSGTLAMLRMDAIKYLWKEIGQRNFDMEKGNKLIEVIRLTMEAVCPVTRPLDEINSPDAHVYDMGKDGGFSYVFGQVNAVPIAFHERNTAPLLKYQRLMDQQKPPNLLPFVMLSTHDGRSVQGIGVHLKNGHVSVREFCRFRGLVESLGGKPKFRSVPKGRIPLETWEKVMDECAIDPRAPEWNELVEFRADEVVLKRLEPEQAYSMRFFEIGRQLSRDDQPESDGILGYAADWIFSGITPYELCCTSRDAFEAPESVEGMDPAMEADRLLCAQLFVLTSGQCVPAIYLNDLFGIKNYYEGYRLSGRPRDLNRRKSAYSQIEQSIKEDPFLPPYIEGLNRLIELRRSDKAYYPGRGAYHFDLLKDSIFLNMPKYEEHSSYILGNILPQRVSVSLDLKEYVSFGSSELPDTVIDRITGNEYRLTSSGILEIEMEPYGRLWFSM